MEHAFQELGQSVAGGLAAILAAAFLLEGFLGYKLLRVWIAITGFGVGFLIGVFVFEQQPFWVGGSVAIGIGCALIAFFFYKVGIFFQAAIVTGGLALALLVALAGGNSGALVIFSAIIGIGAGMTAVVCIRPFVILTTGIPCGLAGGVLLLPIFGMYNGIAMIFVGLLMAVVCCVVQFKTTVDGGTIIPLPERRKEKTE